MCSTVREMRFGDGMNWLLRAEGVGDVQTGASRVSLET